MNTVKVSFLLRTNKQNQRGESPIYLRFTVNGRRAELATKKYVLPGKWNAQAQRVKGTSPLTKAVNSHLDQLTRIVVEPDFRKIRTALENGDEKAMEVSRILPRGTHLRIK